MANAKELQRPGTFLVRFQLQRVPQKSQRLRRTRPSCGDHRCMPSSRLSILFSAVTCGEWPLKRDKTNVYVRKRRSSSLSHLWNSASRSPMRDFDNKGLKHVNHLCPCDPSINSLDVAEVNEAGCPVYTLHLQSRQTAVMITQADKNGWNYEGQIYTSRIWKRAEGHNSGPLWHWAQRVVDAVILLKRPQLKFCTSFMKVL